MKEGMHWMRMTVNLEWFMGSDMSTCRTYHLFVMFNGEETVNVNDIITRRQVRCRRFRRTSLRGRHLRAPHGVPSETILRAPLNGFIKAPFDPAPIYRSVILNEMLTGR